MKKEIFADIRKYGWPLTRSTGKATGELAKYESWDRVNTFINTLFENALMKPLRHYLPALKETFTIAGAMV